MLLTRVSYETNSQVVVVSDEVLHQVLYSRARRLMLVRPQLEVLRAVVCTLSVRRVMLYNQAIHNLNDHL